MLVAVGLLIGAMHKFRGGSWILITFIGLAFLCEEFTKGVINISHLIWPLVLIAIGIFMLVKRNNVSRWQHRMESKYRRHWDQKHPGWDRFPNPAAVPSDEDFIYISSIFSGENKIVLSKNFQGGRITAIFGGAEVNFTQADISGIAYLEITATFGGVELVVPSNWDVKVEVNTIMGSVEDQRPIELIRPDPNKTLVLRGNCTFGGVEIKSYA